MSTGSRGLYLPALRCHAATKVVVEQSQEWNLSTSWVMFAGANDGLLSTAALILGVDAGSTSQRDIILAGISGKVLDHVPQQNQHTC